MQTVQTLPNYHRHANSPVLNTGVNSQIEIFSPAIVQSGAVAIFPLHGSFVIPESDESKTTIPILQAVVVLLRGPNPASRQLADDGLLFPGDVRREKGLIYGHFNLDLFTHFNLIREPAKYWISASLFNQVSTIVTVEVA